MVAGAPIVACVVVRDVLGVDAGAGAIGASGAAGDSSSLSLRDLGVDVKIRVRVSDSR